MLYNSATTFDGIPETVLANYQNQLATSGAYDDALVRPAYLTLCMTI